MPARTLSHNQKGLVARNRANAAKSTGPRTAAGKAVSAKNALTHGLTAQTPRDEADVADRDRRIAELAAVIAPGDAYEQGLVAGLASAVQRLERADHLERRTFEVALPLGLRRTGAIRTLNSRYGHAVDQPLLASRCPRDEAPDPRLRNEATGSFS